MSLPWWGWGAIAGVAVAGLGMVFAPVVGGWLARRDVWLTCPACGRELIGYPPEHRLADRRYCHDVQVLQSARAAQRRSARAEYWRWLRGRRSP